MNIPKDDRQQNTQNFRKTEYLRTTPGVHLIRLLPPVHTEYTHYVRRSTIACIGDECPVCANNKRIIMEKPDTFKNDPEYSYARFTYYANVLDRTPAKICPNEKCGAENKADFNGNYPGVCTQCQTVIADVVAKPLNKVKVLSRGKEMFEQQLGVIQATERDENNEPIGLENYDIKLTVGMENKQPVPSARLDRMDVVEVPEDELFDLTKAAIRLEADEISELLRGVSLKDIFAGRRAETVSEDTSDIPFDVEEEVTDAVNKLFDN